MVLFIILLLILVILVVIGIIAVSAFGAGIIILFGDVIVCAAIIIFIISKIIKNKK